MKRCDPIYICWTCRDLAEAKRISRQLLARRLIACASIWPSVHSLYAWKGEIEEAEEAKTLLKTERRHFANIQKLIEEESSYSVSEIMQIPIERGASPYLGWLASAVGPPPNCKTFF